MGGIWNDLARTRRAPGKSIRSQRVIRGDISVSSTGNGQVFPAGVKKSFVSIPLWRMTCPQILILPSSTHIHTQDFSLPSGIATLTFRFNMSCCQQQQDRTIVQRAACELENLRKEKNTHHVHDGLSFPRNCKRLLFQIPGNTRCVDCGSASPEWASVTYGVLLCMNCSGRHRSYGVSTSRVRSIDLDAWSHSQVLALLEGGNQQMKQFFLRHHMDGKTLEELNLQYQTKAADFYKTHLHQHVTRVAEAGVYHGREVSRKNPRGYPRSRDVPRTVLDAPSSSQGTAIEVQ